MDAPLSFRRPGSDEPAPFASVAIVGVGLVGGSIAMAVRRRWPSVLVIGVDVKPVVEQASVTRVIDVGAEDLGMVSEAELIVLAAPVRENVALLHQLPDYISRESTVTDVSSTKRAVVDAAQSLPERLSFVAGHPLAGAVVGGLAHARPDLFENRPWFLCPANRPAALHNVEQFVRGLGAAPRTIVPDEHDRMMAFLSHLPQLAASALMGVVGDGVGGEGLALSGRGLHDTTRLASSPANVWVDICATNADKIGPALDALIARLQQLRNHLTSDATVSEILRDAQRWRAKMPKP